VLALGIGIAVITEFGSRPTEEGLLGKPSEPVPEFAKVFPALLIAPLPSGIVIDRLEIISRFRRKAIAAAQR
jgi:hypothetical protein